MAAWAPHAARSEGNTDKDAGWAAITRCAAIAEDDARHACTDDVLREAGLLGVKKSAKTPQQRERFGLQTPPPKPADPAKKREEDKLEVTLATIAQAPDGKLVVTTTDGAVWHQVESNPIHQLPEQGQAMTIRRTAFGGFMCEPKDRLAFRCFRKR